MDSAVLGLYYGNGHVYGSLFMPATPSQPAHETLLSFSGSRFLTDENPLGHGILVPISVEAGQRILTSYKKLEQAGKQGNPFYHTAEGQRVEKHESAGLKPTNCCHYILALCKESGVPLAAISEDLYVTFDAEKLPELIDRELGSSASVSYAGGTAQKCKQVGAGGRPFGSHAFFFRFATERSKALGFDDMRMHRTGADGQPIEQSIIEYLSQERGLDASAMPSRIIPANSEKTLQNGKDLTQEFTTASHR